MPKYVWFPSVLFPLCFHFSSVAQLKVEWPGKQFPRSDFQVTWSPSVLLLRCFPYASVAQVKLQSLSFPSRARSPWQFSRRPLRLCAHLGGTLWALVGTYSRKGIWNLCSCIGFHPSPSRSISAFHAKLLLLCLRSAIASGRPVALYFHRAWTPKEALSLKLRLPGRFASVPLLFCDCLWLPGSCGFRMGLEATNRTEPQTQVSKSLCFCSASLLPLPLADQRLWISMGPGRPKQPWASNSRFPGRFASAPLLFCHCPWLTGGSWGNGRRAGWPQRQSFCFASHHMQDGAHTTCRMVWFLHVQPLVILLWSSAWEVRKFPAAVKTALDPSAHACKGNSVLSFIIITSGSVCDIVYSI